MLVEPRVKRIVDEFWIAAGKVEPFPRDLEEPIMMGLPLAIVKIPRLMIKDAKDWFASRNVTLDFEGSDRRMHGCLVAQGGKGVIFVDGSDPDDHRRFTLAHETAHFLLDYLEVRNEALRQFGPDILTVFDGHRAPTTEERVLAVLNRAPLGVYTHLMTRKADGSVGDVLVWHAESRADQLALELLAPVNEVIEMLHPKHPTMQYFELVQEAKKLLVSVFGLPPDIAASYGRHLVDAKTGGPSFLQKWGWE